MKLRGASFIFLILFSFTFISASMGYGNDNLPNLKAPISSSGTTNINYSTVNTNNSYYWGGYSWHNMSAPFFSWLSGFIYNYNQTQDVSGYVPYTGATSNVDLNGKNLTNVSRLGIGTTTPTATLDVNGNATIRILNVSGDPLNNLTSTVASIMGTLRVLGVSGANGSSGSLVNLATGYGGTGGGAGGAVTITTGGGQAYYAGTGGASGTIGLTTGLGGAGNTTTNGGGASGGISMTTSAGGRGFSTTSTGIAQGGVSGNIAFNTGNGGDGYSLGNNNGTGGTAGILQLTGGTGGVAIRASANRNTGGTGGGLQITSGIGGSASNAKYSFAGASGSILFTANTGGASTANSTYTSASIGLGGAGGAISFTGGNGGASAGSNTNNTGGNGTTITFTSGGGGSATLGRVNIGGAGGDINFVTKDGGAGNTSNGLNKSGNINFKFGTTILATFDTTLNRFIQYIDMRFSDNIKAYFGSSDQSSIYYNGSDMLINPKDVGTGQLYLQDGIKVNGNLDVEGNMSIKRPYGMFSSTEDQTLALADTAYPVTFNWTEDNYLINKQGNQNFTITQDGDYLIEISVIAQSAVANKKFHIFPQIMNTSGSWNTVTRSNTETEIRTSGSDYVIAVPFILDIRTGEKFRLMWGADNNGVFLNYKTNTSWSPETPSIIMTMSKISEITD